MKLWAILPELVLGGACLALVPVAGLAGRRWPRLTGMLALAVLAAALVLTARMLGWSPVGAFEGNYAVDGFAHVFKLVILAGALLTQVALLAYFGRREPGAHAPVALLFATLGAVGLASSIDLALIVLFLQMMSMAGYVLAVLVRTDGRALEASIKYLIYGGVALAVMAYGLTFVYGLTGSLDLRVIGRALGGADAVWLAAALALVLVGYGFEIALVPFHPWMPDVVTGATSPVSGFITVVPKVAGLAALLRFLLHALPGELVAWPVVVGALAALTMTFANLVALKQTGLKRMLAWSSVAQAGYLLMGVAVASRVEGALAAVVYYGAAYLFMNLGAFAVAAWLERAAGTEDYDTLAGLGRRAPWPMAVLTLALLSLAGFPPLAGFAGKVLLLQAVLDGGMAWLAVVAAVNWTVALWYYVRPLARAWLDSPGKAPAPVPVGGVGGSGVGGSGVGGGSHGAEGPGWHLAYAANTLGTLALGIVPGPFVEVGLVAAAMLG